MKKFVLTSSNKNKVEEIKFIFSSLKNIQIVPYTELLKDFEVEETGKTFEENAKLKAETICKKTGLPTIADDSGLCIKLLNNEPGIFSKRTAESEGGYDKYFEKLHDQLRGKDKDAYFICAIAFAEPNKLTKIFEGKCNGFLTFPARGKNGFGYDPIFVANGMGCTFAELTMEEKNSINHRAMALEKFINYIKEEEEREANKKSAKPSTSSPTEKPEEVKSEIKPPLKKPVKKPASSNPMEEHIKVDIKMTKDDN